MGTEMSQRDESARHTMREMPLNMWRSDEMFSFTQSESLALCGVAICKYLNSLENPSPRLIESRHLWAVCMYRGRKEYTR